MVHATAALRTAVSTTFWATGPVEVQSGYQGRPEEYRRPATALGFKGGRGRKLIEKSRPHYDSATTSRSWRDSENTYRILQEEYISSIHRIFLHYITLIHLLLHIY